MECQSGLGEQDGWNVVGPRYVFDGSGRKIIKTEAVACKNSVKLRDRLLSLISGSVDVPRQCQGLNLGVLRGIHQIFQVQSRKIRNGDGGYFEWA